MHVHGYREKGNINTPLELALLNETSRFHLVIDVLDRVPARRERHLREEMKNAIIDNMRYATSTAPIGPSSTTGYGRCKPRQEGSANGSRCVDHGDVHIALRAAVRRGSADRDGARGPGRPWPITCATRLVGCRQWPVATTITVPSRWQCATGCRTVGRTPPGAFRTGPETRVLPVGGIPAGTASRQQASSTSISSRRHAPRWPSWAGPRRHSGVRGRTGVGQWRTRTAGRMLSGFARDAAAAGDRIWHPLRVRSLIRRFATAGRPKSPTSGCATATRRSPSPRWRTT